MARTDTLGNYLEDVATAIKTAKGDDTPIRASEFDGEIEGISFHGKGYDVSKYKTQNSFRVSNCITEFPDFTVPNNTKTLESFFASLGNLKSIPLFDLKYVTNLNAFAFSCESIEDFPAFDTSNIDVAGSLVSGCRKLRHFPRIHAEKMYVIGNMFDNCVSLEDIGGLIGLGKSFWVRLENNVNSTLNLSYTIATHDSLMNVINDLYDLNLTYNVANGGTLYRQTLKLGATLKAKLTAEEIQIATDKGWNVT